MVTSQQKGKCATTFTPYKYSGESAETKDAEWID